MTTVAARPLEELRVVAGPRSGATMAVAIDRTVDGRSLGGCRVWSYGARERALADVERLARAMSFKAAAAGLRLGGAKGVIDLPAEADRRAVMLDFAELVDSLEGRYITAQDVGLTEDDIELMATVTPHVSGRRALAGDPSPYTAHGVEVAIRASLDRDGALAGRTVVVVGLGHVGGELARRLHRAGARLVVSDVNEARRALARELDADWVAPDRALDVEADVFAPCALGGVIDDDTVARLRCPVVAGAANNQLAEDRHAVALHERGIRWAPDFIANAGGLIAVADESLHGFDRERVERRVEAIGDTLREVFARTDTDTLTAAKELAAQRLNA
jgi:leucine dehydrogenase